MELIHFGPGSALPAWVEALEREVFGEAWGVLEDREQMWALEGCGYARWGLIPAAGEAELLRIAVHPEAQGQGHGRRLLRISSAAIAALGISELHLEVRVSNAPARHLYETEGWRFTGLRRGYYRDGEDATLYEMRPTDHRPALG
jgi:ribosomal-protein-alanine N-acetyltransferase